MLFQIKNRICIIKWWTLCKHISDRQCQSMLKTWRLFYMVVLQNQSISLWNKRLMSFLLPSRKTGQGGSQNIPVDICRQVNFICFQLTKSWAKRNWVVANLYTKVWLIESPLSLSWIWVCVYRFSSWHIL